MIKSVSISLLILVINLYSMTYDEALHVIQKHETVKSASFKLEANIEKTKNKASWTDPVIKLSAKNFPIKTFKSDQSPMTSLEFGISQKVPLTSKYDVIKREYGAMEKVYEHSMNDKIEMLKKTFWETLILERKVKQELEILQENKEWIEKILSVSKKLYITGKASSQAILDIQIRLAEIQSDISKKNYELLQLSHQFIYLTGDDKIEKDSIPWENLEIDSSDETDNKEFALREMLNSKEHTLLASKLDKTPDVTIALSYNRRSNIDGLGDFVSSTLSFPIPLTDKKNSKYAQAFKEKLQATQDLEAYKKDKKKNVSLLINEIDKLRDELKIVKNSMVDFAKNSRDIAAKSYAVGNSTYFELLQSEINLQKILLREVALNSKIDIQRVALKYIKGELLK